MFVGCFQEAGRLKRSGEAESDVIIKAHELFYNKDKRFQLENAWQVLRSEPNWSVDYLEKINRSNTSSGSSKRSRSDGGAETPGSYTPTSMFSGSPIERPIGIKAAKKGKGKQAMSAAQEARLQLATEKDANLAKMHDLKMAKEIRKREKQKGFLEIKRMEFLEKLMSQGNLPPEGEELKRKLFKELASDSSD